MRSRRKAREAALQALYQCDALENWSVDCIQLYFESFTNEEEIEADSIESQNFKFTRTLLDGVLEYITFLDKNITACSTHWNLSRMSRVDRNILRLAAFEIAFLDEVPVSVSINEAIEVAKRFGADDSPMFVNGVLDNLAGVFRENPDLVQEALGEKQKAAANA